MAKYSAPVGDALSVRFTRGGWAEKNAASCPEE